jgi:IS30 family transposase
MSPKEIDLFIDAFCVLNKITKKELLSKNRAPRLVKTRAVLICALRDKKLTLSQIGRAMNKHHATIIHSLKKSSGFGYGSGSVLERESFRNKIFIKTLEDEIIAIQAKIIHYTECVKSLQ